MSKINKVDTDGVKPLLGIGELGYDNYPAGGDVGRVYVGTGAENIAIAKKSEIDDVINGSVLIDGRDVSLDGAKLDTIESGAQVNDVNTTVQGNTFNGNSQLVQTTVEGKLPVLDGSNLTNVVSAGSVDLTTAQTIAGVKTFSSNPLSSASQSTNSNALTKYSAVVKNTGNETIAGVKTFSSSPIVPTPTTGTQVANKDYVDANAGEIITAGTGLSKSGTTLNFYPFGLTTATTELTTSDYVVVSDSTTPKKITLANFANELLNSTGSAPYYGCRAWVNFNGTGTVAIRGSGNVSSITDNGVGDYTINFTTAMPDTNGSVSAIGQTTGVNEGSLVWLKTQAGSSLTTTSVRICSGRPAIPGVVVESPNDIAYINVTVCR